MKIQTIILNSGSLSNIFNGAYYTLIPSASSTEIIKINNIIWKYKYSSSAYDVSNDSYFDFSVLGGTNSSSSIVLIPGSNIGISQNILTSFSPEVYLNGTSFILKYSGSVPTTGNSTLQLDIYYDTQQINDTSPKFVFENEVDLTSGLIVSGSVDTISGSLIYADKNVVDWNNQELNDTAGNVSLDWKNRRLIDDSGDYSSDWNSRVLYDVNQNTALSYTNTGSNNGVRLYGTASYALVAPPGGPNTSIQFNDSGTFSGSSNFTFNKSTNRVELTGSLNVSSSFTASGLNYPNADNGEESFIQTDGNGNLSLQYVRTIYEGIYNGEATNLIKGTPVYVSGSVGADAKVFRADPLNPSKMPAIYIAADTIAPGDTGRGVALGLINGVNTTGYPAGTEIYLAPGGGWTNIRPTGSAIVQVLGYVTSEGAGGKGVVLNPGPATIPNLPSGSVWVGNSDSVPVAILTSSLSVASASWANNALTASYTPNALITASVSSNVLTFTKGNGTTFNLTVNTGSGGGSTSPGGLNTYIQYRSGSSFAGNAGLTYDYVSSSLEHGLVVDATGQYSHAEGNFTTATGQFSHAEGSSTQAIGVGSHAEGASTQTPGEYSHAEGSGTTANGDRSHAEGLSSQTSGSHSHAEGYNTITYAPSSHAEGYGSITNFLIDTAVSESITLYAYNNSSGLVITDGSYPASTTQIDYLLWTDDDNQKIYLSTLNASYVSNPDNNSSRPIFHISNYDSQGPSSNITVGGTVYKLDTATSTWGGAVNSRYPIGLLDYDNLLIEVYDTDLTAVPAFAGVVATLPSYGTYVFKVDTVNYSSNTSSITLDSTTPQQQIGTYDNAGSPSLTGVTTTNGHIFLTDVAGTWVGGYEEGNLIVSSLSTTQQYNFVNKTFKTNTSASVYPTNSFIKTNSTITTVLGSNISASITYVTTSAQLGPIFNDTLTIQVGESSHAGGLNTETYGSYQTTVGAYNTLNNYTDLFVVGGGTDANNRKDVLAVSLNTVTISGSIIFAQPTSPAFNGEIVKFGSGTLTTGQLYFYSSSGTWSLSNANSTGSSTGMLGIAIGSSPTTNGLLIRGYAVSSSYNYGTGSIVYMATGSGTMTATSPSSSNHVVRVMGYQISANTMYFDPDKTWVTLA